MITKELQTAEEILRILRDNWNDADETKLPPMFHGTDFSLVGASKAEREQLNDACEVIISDLVKLYEEHSISMLQMDDRLFQSRDSHGNSAWAYRFAKARAEKSTLYSYGDFYVSNHPQRAIGYSQEAWIFGETGWTANRLIEGANALKLDLPDNENFITAYHLLELRKQREKDPVVLLIANGNSSELYDELGHNLKEFWKEEFPKEIRSIKNGMMSADSYRLDFRADDSALEFFVIKKSHYDELLSAWETLYKERKNDD